MKELKREISNAMALRARAKNIITKYAVMGVEVGDNDELDKAIVDARFYSYEIRRLTHKQAAYSND